MKKILKIWKKLGVSSGLSASLLRLAVYALLLFFAFEFITIDFQWLAQLALGGLTIVIAYALHRSSESEAVTMTLMAASMLATARYAYWRYLSVIRALLSIDSHLTMLDFFFILLLLSAETYAWVILYLGYMQSIRPLRRAPVPLPGDVAQWPHVDVLIPTYNEPLSVVRSTVFAAQNIDYPPDKLHVYVLDDGRRDHFEEFCAEAGVGYMRRNDNRHAKAGNINHALQRVASPYAAIFDCDHVPTRSFLQITLGWLLKDRRLGMLQTPHFFYSPDPFERNLDHFKEIPNEGELFYGVLQDGNDLWNATFFCGSCAILRRSALDEIGGVATETVTEDAHTSLRMQMRGWETAYINIPQAAGLATETLASHIGQRIRWARGMTQILRSDCPLFVKGLTWPQRLCYFNSMIHFLYAGPRLIFLTAPLVYMLFGHTCIPGFWGVILAYALPHIFLSTVTNLRIQGRHRFSFWNEVYETILAPYILAPTLLALVNPKLGKFRVTAKGRILQESHFDFDIALPYVILILLNLIALASIPIHVFYGAAVEPSTVVMNALWILFNTVLLGTAASVAMERKQLRKDVRLEMCLPVEVRVPGRRPVFGESVNMSLGGASLRLEQPVDLPPGEQITVLYPLRDQQADFKATVIEADSRTMRVQYHRLSLEEEEQLTLVLFSGADTWLNRMEGRQSDRPMQSLRQLVKLSIRGVGFALKSLARRKKRDRAAERVPVTTGFLLALLALWLPVRMQAAATPAGLVLPSSPAATSAGSGAFHRELSFQELTPGGALPFNAPRSAHNVTLVLPSDEVVQQGVLHLHYAISPYLIAKRSLLRILLNGALVAALPAPTGAAVGRPVSTDLPVPASLFLRKNTFQFQLEEDSASPCATAENLPWARIEAGSSVEIAGDLLPLADDLGQLPRPFFEKDVSGPPAAIPFVFLEDPDRQTLTAAGVVASWFGVQAGSQRLELPVSIGSHLPQGNVILFADHPWSLPANLGLKVEGPMIAERTNPDDPYGKVLILAGANGSELLTAARALALQRGLSGAGAEFTPTELRLRRRSADDAPLWQSTTQRLPLWMPSGESKTSNEGTDPLSIQLRLPPDLYYGDRTFVRLHLDYSYSPLQSTDGSVLRITLNGMKAGDLPLPPGQDASLRISRVIPIPVAELRPFANRIQFSFLPRIAKPAACDLPHPVDLNGAIRSSSFLELRQLRHWTSLPDLRLFSAAGFPFTRYADLAQTTVILPWRPSPGEISVYLMLLESFGSETGYPALHVSVGEPSRAGTTDDLVIGTARDQPDFALLDGRLPVGLRGPDLSFAIHDGPLSAGERLWWQLAEMSPHWKHGLEVFLSRKGEKDSGNDSLAVTLARSPEALIQETESPWRKDRTVVSILLCDDDGASALVNAFGDAARREDLTGSVSVLRDGQFASYRTEEHSYNVGQLAWWERVRYRLRQFPWLIVVLNFVLGLLLVPWMQARLDRRRKMRLEVGDL